MSIPDSDVDVQQPASPFAVARTQHDKNAELLSVKDFGAIGNGIADDRVAITRMISTVGFARFTIGSYLTTTTSLDGPLLFERGASLTVASGQTLTIRHSIESPRQHIFRGDGNYVLTHQSTAGENSRQVHVSWFGAFPYPGLNPVDQAPFINKAFASMQNGRESIVDFDTGNYTLRSTVNVTRCGWVRGSGTRRTVFRHDTDGFDSFVTSEVGCKFSDIQFEVLNGSTRNNAYIRIQHGYCEIYNVDAGETKLGIVVNADNCRISNIRAVYGVNPGAGSSLVLIQGGANHTVKNLLLGTSSSLGPSAIVHVGGPNQSLDIYNVEIEDVNYICPSIGVLVDAQQRHIVRGMIGKVRYNGKYGTSPQHLIKLVTANSYNISSFMINDCYATDNCMNGIGLHQNSSGDMEDILIDNIVLEETATGNGVEFIQAAGELKGVNVGSNMKLKRAVPYYYSGNPTYIRIDPHAIVNAQPAYCYDYTIADDSAIQIDLHKKVYTGMVMVTVGSDNFMLMLGRCAPSPVATVINASANMTTLTVPLTGTTGLDGKFSVGVTDGNLYLENRLGSSRRVSAMLLTGIS